MSHILQVFGGMTHMDADRGIEFYQPFRHTAGLGRRKLPLFSFPPSSLTILGPRGQTSGSSVFRRATDWTAEGSEINLICLLTRRPAALQSVLCCWCFRSESFGRYQWSGSFGHYQTRPEGNCAVQYPSY